MTISPIEAGRKAPAFKLKDKSGSPISLSDFKGKNVVLFFYPKDNTPGCTIEAKAFSKDIKKFEKLNSVVIGISGGDEKSKTKFCDKHKLKTILLSDSDFNIAKKYGVFGEKKFMGKTFNGIKRTTFLIDANGKILKVFDKVKPLSHSKEVLELISEEK